MSAERLLEQLQDSLALLKDYEVGSSVALPAEPLPSLLERCQLLCDAASETAPLRSLHHFSCTGGTLISKSVAAQPNTVVLSQIDPLSLVGIPPSDTQPPLNPTDLIAALRVSSRPPGDDVVIAAFRGALTAIEKELRGQGRYLVLRDHAHSQFCTSADPAGRPTLHELLGAIRPVRAVLTLRHPLDSFISMQENGWLQFRPGTLDEYCRRYRLFLDRHESVPRITYEAFVEAPEQVLEDLCDMLALPFSPVSLDLLETIRMSGDSGRAGARIAPRPRPEIPEALADRIQTAPHYLKLCEECGYEP